MNIKETIESTPALLALMPDAKAIAEAMSVNRTKLGTVSRAWLATWSAGNGMRAVIQDTTNAAVVEAYFSEITSADTA